MAAVIPNPPIIVSGPNAFFRDPNYQTKTIEELSKPSLVEPAYTANLPAMEDRSTFFSMGAELLFPKLTLTLHEVAKRAILPSSIDHGERQTLSNVFGNVPAQMLTAPDIDRQKLIQNPEWKFKRISIQVENNTIDAILVVKETNNPDRWMLVSQGNAGSYEKQLQNKSFYGFLNQLHSNAILFNYPGVHCSTGEATIPNIVSSYLGTLDFTENVLGAKQIIAEGFSLGGGVEGEAFKDHIPKPGVQYLLIKDRTFSKLTNAAESMVHPLARFGMDLLGLELDPYSCSSSLLHPEIIVQSSHEPSAVLLNRAEQVKDDGAIPATASLAFSILKDGKTYPNKRILGVPHMHNDSIFQEPLFVSTIINMLDPKGDDPQLQQTLASMRPVVKPPAAAPSASSPAPSVEVAQPSPPTYDELVKRRTALRSQLRVVAAQATIAQKNLAKIVKDSDPASEYNTEKRKLEDTLKRDQSLQIQLRELDFEINEAEAKLLTSQENMFKPLQAMANSRLSATAAAN